MKIIIKNNHLILILLFIICIFLIIFTKGTAVQEDTQAEVKEEVQEDIHDDFTIKIDDINKLINNQIHGYLYIGRDTCPVCVYFNKYIKSELNKTNTLKVFKFDTDFWRTNENFQYILDKYNVNKIPALIKINQDNSINIFTFNNYDDKDNIDDSEIEKQLTDFFNS